VEIIINSLAKGAKIMSRQGFREVGGSGPINAVPYAYWKDFDTSVVGIYKKTKEDKYGKPNYYITLTENFYLEVNDKVRSKGKNKGKGFEDLDLKAGDTFVLNAAGDLDRRMAEIDLGQEVMVTLKGKGEITDEKHEYCGAEFYEFEVLAREVDPSSNSEEKPKLNL
jgi:hypothetical protein